MIVRRAGGLTEFIPSPQEKRDGILRDHAIDLLANLEERLRRIEGLLGIPSDGATEFADLMAAIRREEHEAGRINQELLDAGLTHQERAT
ncbi:MAG TPA: VrlD [bacterium]|nr:VrlD [bacterium]